MVSFIGNTFEAEGMTMYEKRLIADWQRYFSLLAKLYNLENNTTSNLDPSNDNVNIRMLLVEINKYVNED
jgi:hypothetical protein